MSNNSEHSAGVKPGYYQHYKGQYYQVIDCARHSESSEWLVIYRALYGDFGLWARPMTMFTESVEIAGELLPRFQYIGDFKPGSLPD